jgi:hypothetical protein
MIFLYKSYPNQNNESARTNYTEGVYLQGKNKGFYSDHPAYSVSIPGSVYYTGITGDVKQ